MYGLGTFGTGLPPPKKYYKKAPPPPSYVPQEHFPLSSPESLEPAIDGPPSPERIRAYTEQMKRSSIFGNNSRSNTISSATSSSRSRESVPSSSDNLSLSRKSSGRSNMGSIPSLRGERPESVQIFGKTIFSRRGKKSRGENIYVGEEVFDEGLAKDRPYTGNHHRLRRSTATGALSPKSQEQFAKHLISEPYNFQHVTHTRQNHLPDLTRSSQMELVSEFSALRASQAPSRGELKGIRAQDLHFDNFSSEALHAQAAETSMASHHSRQHRQRGVLRKSVAPQAQRPALAYTKSHDNFRLPPPPRPPRSPMSPTCPIALPARTSSRTSSVLFDTFDPLSTASIQRPQTSGGFKRPAPFGVISPPPLPKWNEQDQYFSNQAISHAVTTPTDEQWPLASPSSTFGGELADVQEEEEEAAKRRSRISVTSGELRLSQSVPAFRLKSLGPESPPSLPTLRRGSIQRPPLSPGFQCNQDSWDNAIDYAYEHEAEADCDYQWDRNSIDDDNATIAAHSTTSDPNPASTPALDLHLSDDDRSIYHGRFRPSLIVPSPFDLPELSPMSHTSTSTTTTTHSSNPMTPHFLRPSHLRSSSHASSFKESHGFTLSPSLLIPSDFKAQMDRDTDNDNNSLYDSYASHHGATSTIFPADTYTHPASPIDEPASSTASFRSSGGAFSRGSARSSSSTRLSSTTSTNARSSQDSTLLLRAQQHHSSDSASSLPDLIHSSLRKDSSLTSTSTSTSASSPVPADADEQIDSDVPSPAPLFSTTSSPASNSNSSSISSHRRTKSHTTKDRKGINHFAPPTPLFTEPLPNLSPVAESFDYAASGNAGAGGVHGRKVSAPVVSLSANGGSAKGRKRANTVGSVSGKRGVRASYGLFPQV